MPLPPCTKPGPQKNDFLHLEWKNRDLCPPQHLWDDLTTITTAQDSLPNIGAPLQEHSWGRMTANPSS